MVTGGEKLAGGGYAPVLAVTADLLSAGGSPEQMACLCDYGFETEDGGDEVYRRSGGSATTLAGETEPCKDPWE